LIEVLVKGNWRLVLTGLPAQKSRGVVSKAKTKTNITATTTTATTSSSSDPSPDSLTA
jgi:hypothetical protein